MKETTVKAGAHLGQYLQSLWSFRGLIWVLAMRDFNVRYKQAIFGVLWSLAKPVMTTIVFTIVFGHIAKMPSPHVPYPLLVLGAIVVWQYFATTTESISASIISNAHLVGKVYFPRMILPLAALGNGFVDLCISLSLLFGLCIYYGYSISVHILALPLLLILGTMMIVGVGLWISALGAKYRDFRILVPFTLQVGFYISPVGFTSQVIPEKWSYIYSLNPMVGWIESVRWSLFSGSEFPSPLAWLSFIIFTMISFSSGLWFFRNNERDFADVV